MSRCCFGTFLKLSFKLCQIVALHTPNTFNTKQTEKSQALYYLLVCKTQIIFSSEGWPGTWRWNWWNWYHFQVNTVSPVQGWLMTISCLFVPRTPCKPIRPIALEWRLSTNETWKLDFPTANLLTYPVCCFNKHKDAIYLVNMRQHIAFSLWMTSILGCHFLRHRPRTTVASGFCPRQKLQKQTVLNGTQYGKS